MATESVGSISYSVEADTSKLVNGGNDVNKTLDKMQSSFNKTDKSAKTAEFQMTKTAAAVQQVAKEAQAAQNPLGGLSKLLLGMVSIQGAMGLVTMAEQYGEMAERIRMATSSADEYEQVQARLLATANATYRPMKEAQELYILTADTLRSMGYSTDQAIDVVDSLSFAFVKNATSQERAQSAIQAFTNSMMKGKVEADSWSTIIAATPSVINDLAAATGKTAAEIRELGATGKITSQQLSEGLRKSLDDNKKAAEGMATTVKDAFTQMRNNLSMYIGEANMANGATGLLSKSIMLFGENIDTVVKGLMVLGAGALTKYVAQMGLAVVASARATIAAKAEAAAELEKARALVASTAAAAANATAMQHLSGSNATATAAVNAHTAAQARLATAQAAARAAGVGLTAMLGGPVGIVALVASAAAGMLLFGGNTEKAIPPVDQLTDSIEKLTAAQLENRRLQAQDAIASLKKSAQESGQGIRGLQKDYEDLLEAKKRGARISEEELAAVRRTMTEAQAENDQRIIDLQAAYDAEMKLAEAQEKRGKTASLSGPAAKADPEVQKNLAAMREQLELAKLEGEARAKLAAIQKLGKNATAEERAEAEKLAAEIFRIENARKGANKEASASEKLLEKEQKLAESYLENLQKQAMEYKAMSAQDQLRYDLAAGTVKLKGDELALAQQLAQQADANQNLKAFQEMGQALAEAALSGEELAKAKARARLNAAATPEEVALMEQLAVQAERVSSAKNADPMANAAEKYAQELVALQTANEMKLIEDQRYLELKTALEADYEDQKRAMAEETFRKQSEYNNMLMSTIDAIGGMATSSIMGLLDGTQSLNDVMRNLGRTVLTSVVDSIVQMGLEYVKNAILAKTMGAATTAASVAMAGTTAAAWAPAAAMASLASFGANSAPAMAGIASTVGLSKGLALMGGRQYGGPVSANGMYRINENGAPEVFNAVNGQQYMLPNRRGEVVSNKDATGGGSGRGVQVNVMNYSSAQVDVRQSQLGADDVIEIVLSDLQSGGEISQFGESRMGWGRQGR